MMRNIIVISSVMTSMLFGSEAIQEPVAKKAWFPWLYKVAESKSEIPPATATPNRPLIPLLYVTGRHGFTEEPLIETPREALEEFQQKKAALQEERKPVIAREIQHEIATKIEPRIRQQEYAKIPSRLERFKQWINPFSETNRVIREQVAQESAILQQEKKAELGRTVEQELITQDYAPTQEFWRNFGSNVRSIARQWVSKPLKLEPNTLDIDALAAAQNKEKKQKRNAIEQDYADNTFLTERTKKLTDEIYSQEEAKVWGKGFVRQNLLNNLRNKSRKQAREQALKELADVQKGRIEAKKQKEEQFFKERTASRQKMLQQAGTYAEQLAERSSVEPPSGFAGESKYPSLKKEHSAIRGSINQQLQEKRNKEKQDWENTVTKTAEKIYQKELGQKRWFQKPRTAIQTQELQNQAFEKARKSVPLPASLQIEQKALRKQQKPSAQRFQGKPLPLLIGE